MVKYQDHKLQVLGQIGCGDSTADSVGIYAGYGVSIKKELRVVPISELGLELRLGPIQGLTQSPISAVGLITSLLMVILHLHILRAFVCVCFVSYI